MLVSTIRMFFNSDAAVFRCSSVLEDYGIIRGWWFSILLIVLQSIQHSGALDIL